MRTQLVVDKKLVDNVLDEKDILFGHGGPQEAFSTMRTSALASVAPAGVPNLRPYYIVSSAGSTPLTCKKSQNGAKIINKIDIFVNTF